MGFAPSFCGRSFPGSKWFGLALIIVFLSVFRFKPVQSAVCLTLCSLVFHFLYMQPRLPAGWEAVNTDFGARARRARFRNGIQHPPIYADNILESHAAVLLFPEHLVTHWNESTDAFWGIP